MTTGELHGRLDLRGDDIGVPSVVAASGVAWNVQPDVLLGPREAATRPEWRRAAPTGWTGLPDVTSLAPHFAGQWRWFLLVDSV